jgi:hypothetical protein
VLKNVEEDEGGVEGWAEEERGGEEGVEGVEEEEEEVFRGLAGGLAGRSGVGEIAILSPPGESISMGSGVLRGEEGGREEGFPSEEERKGEDFIGLGVGGSVGVSSKLGPWGKEGVVMKGLLFTNIPRPFSPG